MSLPVRPNPQSFVQPLTPGSGPTPWTSGFDAARDGWTSGWKQAATSWESAIRAQQRAVRGNSANFGAAQLQGMGSQNRYADVARRWSGLAGKQLVGTVRDGDMRFIENGGSYSVTGLDGWMARVDGEVRARVLAAMDRRVGAWFYRQVFHESQSITYPGQAGSSLTSGEASAPARADGRTMKTRTYSGWPVGSGYSRSMLRIEIDATASALIFRVRSLAPYTLIAPVTNRAWLNLRRGLSKLVIAISTELGADLRKLDA